MTGDQFAVLVLVIAFLTGVRSTWHLREIHIAEPDDTPRNRITRAIYLVALVITVAAGYFGFLSARRVLGFDPIPGTGIVSILIASLVLLIPLFLDLTVRSIRNGGRG